ncbi:MAG: CotH kinase family protein [Bacteroidota bacterium]
MFKITTLCLLLSAGGYWLRAQETQLFINEFMLSNDHTLADEDNDFPDWIELYNAGTAPVNLSGYGLTDDEEAPFQWVFPAVTIAPEDFLVVFASGKDRVDGPYLHTNFKLKAAGEAIQLTAPTAEVVDYFRPVSVATDISYGRATDGGAYLEALSVSSPNASNTSVSGITFSHPSGFYTEPIELSMLANTEEEIYYTTDGTDPDLAAFLFSENIELSELTDHPDVLANLRTSPSWSAPSGDQFNAHVIKAATFTDGVRTSKIYHKTIFIAEDINTRFSDFHLVSILTDPDNLFHPDTGIYVQGVHYNPANPVWSGNYFKKGRDWERVGHFQYFSPAGALLLNHGVGLRTHGGKGRNHPQKSLRLYARSEYGNSKINYPLFEQRSYRIFDKVVLRQSSGCWNRTLIKDECSAKICEDLAFESLAAQPVIVFINGEYWGMHNLREYFDHHYVAERFDLAKDSVNIVVHRSGNLPDLPPDWGTIEGSNQGHIDLYAFLHSHDLADPQHYETVQSFLDIQSIVDYYCAEIFFNNKDWPRYNNKLWNYGTSGLWRQVFFDLDGGWGHLPVSYNVLGCITDVAGCSVQTYEDGTFLFRKLLESPAFRERFVARMACLMRNEFAFERVSEIVEAVQQQYTDGISDHLARWNYPSSIDNWESAISDRLIGFAEARADHIVDHITEEFGIAYDPDTYDCELVATEEDAATLSAIRVFPNPSAGQLFFDFGAMDASATYTVFNLSGQAVQAGMVQHRTRIDLALESGIYLLQFLINEQVVTRKIIVTKR